MKITVEQNRKLKEMRVALKSMNEEMGEIEKTLCDGANEIETSFVQDVTTTLLNLAINVGRLTRVAQTDTTTDCKD